MTQAQEITDTPQSPGERLAALVQSVRTGDVTKFETLFEDSAMRPHGGHLAILASWVGQTEILGIIGDKCGLAALHARQHLPLRIAARKGDLALFKFLQSRGGSVAARDGQAARLAAIYRHDEILNLCITGGCSFMESLEKKSARPIVEAPRLTGPLVFLHLAKTGGTTFGSILLRIFDRDNRLNYGRFSQGKTRPARPTGYWVNDDVEKAVISLPPERQSAPYLVSGHFSYRVRSVLPSASRYISIIRDPIERFISLYYYHISRPDTSFHNTSLEDFIKMEQPMRAFSFLLNDHQARSLSGDSLLDPDHADPASYAPPVTDTHLKKTIEEIEHSFVALGTTERMDEFSVLTAGLMGWSLVPMISGKRNVTKGRPKREQIRDEVIDEISRLNQKDLALVSYANARLDRQIDVAKREFDRDMETFEALKEQYEKGESFPKLLKYERQKRGQSEARIAISRNHIKTTKDEGGLTHSGARGMYLDLMEEILINRIYDDPSIAPWLEKVNNPQARGVGRDWPAQAHSMMGMLRMRNLRTLAESLIADETPGDFIETGVWRGGGTIMMRAVLKAYGDMDRAVWVADSFDGVPTPDTDSYPADLDDTYHKARELAVPLHEVADNFRKYGLLDDQVRFVAGDFKDTLQAAPIERLALLRLDGGTYESTILALEALYDKLSPGGYVIVDDYGAIPSCCRAVDLFRKERGIEAPLHSIDWSGAYWQK